MNDPRCELMSGPDGRQCLNQAAGFWLIGDPPSRRVALCEDDRTALDEQGDGREPITKDWEPLHPDPVRFATERRLAHMAAGYFG